MYVNDEIQELQSILNQAKKLLKIGGRIVIVSFHGGETKIIKNYFKENTVKKLATSKYSNNNSYTGCYKKLTKKAIKTSDEEKKNNIRSRSAILRAAIKINT